MFSIVVLTHNRLPHLMACLKSIRDNTKQPYEIIVVDNASTDGTKEYLVYQKDIELVNLSENRGVVARNYGFALAKYPLIAQVDDDVTLLPNWDNYILEEFGDIGDDIGAVGPQGGLIKSWMNLSVHEDVSNYVDFLTGFFWVFRNIGLRYDEEFGKFWHEELDLSLQYKAKGYRLKVIKKPVCSHNCQRTEEVDWTLHNKNKEYVYNKWEDRFNYIRWESNMTFAKSSKEDVNEC